MRRLKKMTLLAAVAAAAVAAIGVGSASASTALCKTAEAPCSTEQLYPKETTIAASLAEGTKAKLTSGFATFNCTGSTVSARTTKAAGEPLPVAISEFTFSGCTSNLGACTTGGYGLPGSASVADQGGGNATFTMGGGYEFTCGGVTCHYSATPSSTLSLTGGSTATLVAGETPFAKATGSSGLCSATMKWSGKYSISSPKPLYSSTGPGTGLCAVNETPCPLASQYPIGQPLEASTSSFTFVGSPFFGTVSCSASTLSGQVEEGSGTTAAVSFSSNTLSSCGSNAGACTASIIPMSGKFTSGSNGNGTLALENFGLTMTCGGAKCIYAKAQLSLPVTGGEPAQATGTNVPLEKQPGSNQLCTATATWSATYSFTHPSPLYLESTT